MSHIETVSPSTVKLMESLRHQAATGIYELEDDRKFLGDSRINDPSIRLRILIERAIVRFAVGQFLERDHAISVYDGADTVLHKSTDFAAIMEKIMTAEQDTLSVYRTDGTTYKYIGWMHLIYGNDGPEVIADDALGTDLDEAWAMAEELSQLI